jgi:hypothetical protein
MITKSALVIAAAASVLIAAVCGAIVLRRIYEAVIGAASACDQLTFRA